MKNKKAILWPSIVLVCCAAVCCLVYFVNQGQTNEEQPPVVEKFNLESELYGGSQLKELSVDEFEKLIEEKKYFVLIAHMDFCPAETPGELVKYLDAESDEDIPYYQSAEGLRNWLNNYINLKEEQ